MCWFFRGFEDGSGLAVSCLRPNPRHFARVGNQTCSGQKASQILAADAQAVQASAVQPFTCRGPTQTKQPDKTPHKQLPSFVDAVPIGRILVSFRRALLPGAVLEEGQDAGAGRQDFHRGGLRGQAKESRLAPLRRWEGFHETLRTTDSFSRAPSPTKACAKVCEVPRFYV